MKYKAIICDFDGTLIPNQRYGMPSKKVLKALQAASKKVSVGIATGRPLFELSYVFPYLPLTSPCILNGGAQIYDPITKKIVKEYPLQTIEVAKLRDVILEQQPSFLLNDGKKDYVITGKLPKNALGGIVRGLSQQHAESILSKRIHFPSIALHKLPSWETGLFDITINHVNATKQHGIYDVAKILGISTHEIISVGDSYNDFPLLMASGLKVAMGNAFADLKAIADYIAPDVQDDGVADIIERYVLPQKSPLFVRQ